MKIAPVNVNTAATYAVACELARRNIQPRVRQVGKSELHYESAAGVTIYLHVAGKQDKPWPLIELPSTSGGSDYLVLVDFEGKAPPEPNGKGPSGHPNFYVLGRDEWDALTATLGDSQTVVDGQTYNLEPQHVTPFHERWDNLPR